MDDRIELNTTEIAAASGKDENHPDATLAARITAMLNELTTARTSSVIKHTEEG